MAAKLKGKPKEIKERLSPKEIKDYIKTKKNLSPLQKKVLIDQSEKSWFVQYARESKNNRRRLTDRTIKWIRESYPATRANNDKRGLIKSKNPNVQAASRNQGISKKSIKENTIVKPRAKPDKIVNPKVSKKSKPIKQITIPENSIKL